MDRGIYHEDQSEIASEAVGRITCRSHGRYGRRVLASERILTDSGPYRESGGSMARDFDMPGTSLSMPR